MVERVEDLTRQLIWNERATDFTRWAIALAVGGDPLSAAEHFASRWPRSKHLELVRKAAIDPLSISGNAADLSPLRPLATAFLEIVRPLTVLGRLQGTRTVPFRINFAVQTAASSVAWLGERKPISFSALSLETGNFDVSKLCGALLISQELARSSDPAAVGLIQADLAASLAQFVDGAFLDPAIAAVTDVSPASITNGAPNIAATGTTATAFRQDVRSLVAMLMDMGANFTAPYWIMSQAQRIGLDLLDSSIVKGGQIGGIPILSTSNRALGTNDSPTSELIILIDAAEVLLADDGVELDISTQATVQVDSDPSDSPPGPAVLVNLWQTNRIALKATRFIRWQRRRESAVGYISGAAYGA